MKAADKRSAKEKLKTFRSVTFDNAFQSTSK